MTDLLHRLAAQTDEFAVILLDADGTITEWNHAAERIFGIPASSAVGSPVSRLFLPEEVGKGLDRTEMDTARAGTEAEDDRWLRREDGSRFWATGVMTPLHDDSGRLVGFGKILRDRTDVREMLEFLRRQRDAAGEQNRRKDIFLSTLAHELRNPLSPLTNAVQIIRMTATSCQEIEPALQMIDRQVQSLGRLVNDLMDVSRIDEGKVDLKMERTTMQDLVGRAVESAMPAIRERRHRIEVVMPPGPLHVHADPARMEQVFMNLLLNAAKYTPEGGRIWVAGTTEGEEAVVHVQDNGVGIDPSMLPRIFDLFTQVESSRERSEGGLGLGLSIVKDLVSLHGGSVTVRSEGPGKGSEFSVRLPLVDRSPQG